LTGGSWIVDRGLLIVGGRFVFCHAAVEPYNPTASVASSTASSNGSTTATHTLHSSGSGFMIYAPRATSPSRQASRPRVVADPLGSHHDQHHSEHPLERCRRRADAGGRERCSSQETSRSPRPRDEPTISCREARSRRYRLGLLRRPPEHPGVARTPPLHPCIRLCPLDVLRRRFRAALVDGGRCLVCLARWPSRIRRRDVPCEASRWRFIQRDELFALFHEFRIPRTVLVRVKIFPRLFGVHGAPWCWPVGHGSTIQRPRLFAASR
jgi:hypothetical protein